MQKMQYNSLPPNAPEAVRKAAKQALMMLKIILQMLKIKWRLHKM